jgi:hypothetical protein
MALSSTSYSTVAKAAVVVLHLLFLFSIMSTRQQYNTLIEQAESAFNNEEWRQAADKYLEAVMKAPSVWTTNRMTCMS